MRERLTGAIIVVALMVLLVPELLTGPIRSAPRAAAAAPSSEGAPLRSYTISLADDHKAASAPTLQAASDPAATPAQAAPPPPPLPPPAPPAADHGGSSEPQSARAAEPSAASGANALPAPATASATASPAPSVAGGWAVQLGSFASRANAERLARQVKAQGFKVGVSRESAGRRLYRVRVGPAHDRAAASALASQLAAAGHRGAVVPK